MDNWSVVILALLVGIFPSFRRVYFRRQTKSDLTKIKDRQIFFDVLKGFSIIAVVLIHVTYFFDHTVNLPKHDLFLSIMNNLSRFAIPFFFICSGILLTPVKSRADWSDFYRRKLMRILVPYLLVTVFLYSLNPTNIGDLFYKIISGTAAVPFYFVVVLVQLYLLFPFLSKLRDSKYFLIVAFLISILYQISPLPSYPFGITLFFKFLFFFAYGIYFREYYLNYKQDKKELHIWMLIIVAYVLLMLASPEKYYNHRYFYGVALFNVLFYYKDYLLKLPKLTRFFASFGQKSLWIFLIHFDLMLVIYPWILRRGWSYQVSFWLFFIDALVLSYFGAWLLGWLYGKLSNYLKSMKV